MVKHLALGLALLAVTAVHAQTQKVFRCVDARGATYYTEKPAPGCKPTGIESGQSTAPAPASKAAAKPPPTVNTANVKRSFSPPPTPKAHCEGMTNESARLNSGKTSPAAEARRARIDKELARSCR